ncbi:NfeD family protein [Chondrinema litorale]|uniref:NfeD family protein n=1 Tax=Chondrinema litorale TaxID=2994555 RepID=UPI00254270FD|nr:NfeD family protein [Chondrinema litorale]UZR94046.1 NfeD family protein [Chondrinema litorale]
MEAVLVTILIAVMLVFFGVRKLLFGDHKLLKNKKDILELLTGTVQTSMLNEPSHLIGKIAEVYTVLKPSGKIVFNDEQYEATTSGEYIDKGTKVKIVGKSLSNVLKVRIAKSEEVEKQSKDEASDNS